MVAGGPSSAKVPFNDTVYLCLEGFCKTPMLLWCLLSPARLTRSWACTLPPTLLDQPSNHASFNPGRLPGFADCR